MNFKKKILLYIASAFFEEMIAETTRKSVDKELRTDTGLVAQPDLYSSNLWKLWLRIMENIVRWNIMRKCFVILPNICHGLSKGGSGKAGVDAYS